MSEISTAPATPVVVIGFDMPFWPLVRFLIKIAIASIPGSRDRLHIYGAGLDLRGDPVSHASHESNEVRREFSGRSSGPRERMDSPFQFSHRLYKAGHHPMMSASAPIHRMLAAVSMYAVANQPQPIFRFAEAVLNALSARSIWTCHPRSAPPNVPLSSCRRSHRPE